MITSWLDQNRCARCGGKKESARINELEAQLAAARAEVHLAFYEGFESRRTDVDLAWDESRAKKALQQSSDTGGGGK
jgi:hypothetical protein